MTNQTPDRATHDLESMTLGDLLERVPEGWTRAIYNGRSYGLARSTRAHGRSVTISARELGGTDYVSANIYRTAAADHLRACEIPPSKVVAFLRAWTPA